MRNRDFNQKKNNKGFSLFTVIIAIAFAGILGMLTIYIAMSNFNMKITDLKGKDSFYTAERAIEEIRVGLQEEVGDAMSEAYIQVLEKYEISDSSQKGQDETRQEDFCKLFYSNLSERVNEVYKQLKEKYVDLVIPEDETLEIVTPEFKSLNPQTDQINRNSKIYLKNLKAIYVDPKGRASIIKTDIRLGIPDVKFATPSTLPDLMNMVVVANGGIICQTDSVLKEGNKLSGTIYAGTIKDEDKNGGLENQKDTSIWVQPNASLSVLSGKYLVCSGEVNVGTSGTFDSESGVSLWARGMTVNSATAKLLGNTYFADDLTVGKGTGSSVTLAGNYYGYGSVNSAKDSKCYYAGQYSSYKDTDLSSAIVINGKSTTVDLSGLKKFMLAGKSYISSTKVPSVDGKTNSKDVMTGESLTVKGTQLAYLVPAEILGNDQDNTESNYNNPMTYEEFTKSGLMQDTIPVKWDTPVESWGGKTLRQIGVDQKKPIQEVYYNYDGGYVYFYLNFSDNGSASSFMNEYYQKNPQMKKNVDQYLSFYFNGQDLTGKNSGIYMNDSQAYLLYVTNGNVLSYDGEKSEGKLYDATHSEMTSKLLNDQIQYQNKWYTLNRKMIDNYGDLEDNVQDSEDKTVPSHNEKDIDQSVYDNLVNERKLRRFVQNKPQQMFKYPDNESPNVMLCNNASNNKYEIQGTDTTLTIDKSLETSLKLVVCTGDVEIAAGVNFQGIIMTDGKITLNPGASLEAAPVAAAKIFQEEIKDGESKVKVQDFFWSGDQYALGNTADNSQNSDGTYKVYDIADCVTYKNWKKE